MSWTTFALRFTNLEFEDTCHKTEKECDEKMLRKAE